MQFNNQQPENNLEETADKILFINKNIWRIMGRIPLILALFFLPFVLMFWGPIFLAGVVMKTMSKKG